MSGGLREQVRDVPGGAPHGGRRTRGLWAVMLVATAATVLALALVAVALHPEPSVADARGAAVTLAGPEPTAYPWSGPVPTGDDPWGFTQGQCTSYVAWWLNSHGVPFANRTRGPAGTGTFGDAGSWDTGARAAGFPVTSTPRVGSVAQWHAGELSPPTGNARAGQLIAGEHGHVAVVVAVGRNEDVVTVGYDGGTHVFERLTTRAPRYLEIGTLPPSARQELPAQDAGDGGHGSLGTGPGSGPRVLSCR